MKKVKSKVSFSKTKNETDMDGYKVGSSIRVYYGSVQVGAIEQEHLEGSEKTHYFFTASIEALYEESQNVFEPTLTECKKYVKRFLEENRGALPISKESKEPVRNRISAVTKAIKKVSTAKVQTENEETPKVVRIDAGDYEVTYKNLKLSIRKGNLLSKSSPTWTLQSDMNNFKWCSSLKDAIEAVPDFAKKLDIKEPPKNRIGEVTKAISKVSKTKVQTESKALESEKVANAVRALSSLDLGSLSEQELSQAVGFAKLTQASEALQERALLAKYSVADLIQDWLKTFSSKHTQRSYERAIGVFLDWLTSKGLHALTCKPRDIDNYAGSQREQVTAGLANLRINAVGSFYSILAKWEVRPSPAIKVKRASIESKAKNIPTQKDLKKVLELINKRSHKVAIILMYKTGLRVGALPTLKIKGRNYTGTSKAKKVNGVLPIELKEKHILDMQIYIERIGYPAWERGLQRYLKEFGYSPHDLRHAFALKVYKDSGKDPEAVRRALGHSDLKVTTAYLAGLQV